VLFVDTFGPLAPSKRKHRFYVVMVCQFTGFLRGFGVSSKAEIPGRLILEMRRLGKEINKKLRVLRSDNGTEYKNSKIEAFCKRHSVIHRFSNPYFPSENGRAERAVRTLKTVMRSLLVSAQLNVSFWSLAANYAVEIVNVLPKKGNTKSPYQLFKKTAPDLSRFKIFGAPGFMTKNNGIGGNKRALIKNTYKIRFVGFSETSKAYKIWNISSRKIETCRDVVLNEKSIILNQQSRFEKGFQEDLTNKFYEVDFEIEKKKIVPKKKTRLILSSEEKDQENIILTPLFEDEKINPDIDSGKDAIQSHSEEDISVPLSNIAEPSTSLPAEQPSFGTSYCEIDKSNILTEKRARKARIPRSFYEVTISPEKDSWLEAFNKEITSLESVGDMRVVRRPNNIFVIPTRTLFDVKFNTFTKLLEKKVRIVARGDIQKNRLLPGEEKKFSAPVANSVTLRIFIIQAQEHEAIEQLDIKTAFLYGRLPCGKYFELADGHSSKKGRNFVWFSETALYGLLEGANAWYFTLVDTILSMGFIQAASDPCLFFFREGSHYIQLLIYVDDILVSGSKHLVEKIKEELGKEFNIKTTDDIKKYVGLDLEKKDGYFLINHRKKIEDTIKEWELQDAKRIKYPIDDISIKEEEVMTEKKKYQSLIGSLNYFAQGSRPDSIFATNFLARRTQKPSKRLFKQAKNILVYLRDTADRGIKLFGLNKRKKNVLRMFVDASFGGEEDRHSVFGFLIYLDNSLIHYRSKKLPLIVLSSTEAEYVGICKAVQELLWIKNILQEMEILIDETIVYSDSQPALKIMKRPGISGRTKHLDLKLNFIKERVRKGEFELRYISSKENIADLLTKALRGQQFDMLCKKIFNMHFTHTGNKMREGIGE